MEPFHSVGLATHPCYTFHQRLMQCAKKEEMHTRMCFAEMEDWYECKSRKKHRAFQNFVMKEMSQMKIYSLPEYDIKTDSFKDGALPANADGYFSKGNAGNYYSWITDKE